MSLVEILIVVAISFVVLAAIFKIFISAKENMVLQDNLARMQENARVAIQALQEDIRMAGFMGEIQEYWNVDYSSVQSVATSITNECFNDYSTTGFRWLAPMVSVGGNSTTAPAIPPKLAGQNNAKSHFDGCISDANYRTATDVLTVHYAGPETIADGALANTTYYLRSNLFNGIVFRSNGGSPPAPSDFASGPNTMNLPVRARTYYVSADNANPSLMRVELASNGTLVTNPVAEGIVSMQVRYGVDTDSPVDGIANNYVDADHGLLGGLRTAGNWPRWAKVRTVRIWLLLRSADKFAGYTDPVGTYAMAGTNYTVEPGYRYQLFVTTVAVRNSSGDES